MKSPNINIKDDKTPYSYWRGDDLYLRIWLQPNAKQNCIVGQHGEMLKIQITAVPVDGKANKVLCDFLAEYFSVPKNTVTISQGKSSRKKIICVKNFICPHP